MTEKNVVVAGDYKGDIGFKNKKKGLYIHSAFHTTYINKNTVASVEVVDEESNKSFGSGVIRGVVGGALLGGIGAIAGVASAKDNHIYRVSITFNDGTRCLCDLDGDMFNALQQIMY